MDRVTFVEVLDRRGRVVQRVRLAALPATVGRGYGNAVILDDRYASPEHARLDVDADGSLVLLDLASTNGTFAEPGGERITRTPLAPGAVFRVGHTLLRVATADQPVPPATVDRAALRRGRALGTPARLAVASAAALGLSMYASYLDGFGDPGFAAYLADALFLGAALLGWSGLWALATRLTSPRFRFPEHLAVATLVLLAVELFILVVTLADLIEAGTGGYAVAEVGGFTLALAAVLYGHLAIATPLMRLRRAVWAVAVAAAFVGLDTLSDVAVRGEPGRAPAFVGAVRPLAGPVGTPLDTFLARAAQLQGRVDAQADSTDE